MTALELYQAAAEEMDAAEVHQWAAMAARRLGRHDEIRFYTDVAADHIAKADELMALAFQRDAA